MQTPAKEAFELTEEILCSLKTTSTGFSSSKGEPITWLVGRIELGCGRSKGEDGIYDRLTLDDLEVVRKLTMSAANAPTTCTELQYRMAELAAIGYSLGEYEMELSDDGEYLHVTIDNDRVIRLRLTQHLAFVVDTLCYTSSCLVAMLQDPEDLPPEKMISPIIFACASAAGHWLTAIDKGIKEITRNYKHLI